MIEMNITPELQMLIIMIIAGTIGAFSRILVQRFSTKTWPHETWTGYAVALTLGAIGGWIAWELPNLEMFNWNPGRLGGYVVGYFFPDLIENLLEGLKPPTP